MAKPETKGPFINLGRMWVRHNLIAYATQRQAPGPENESVPYCSVVLNLPGVGTLQVPGTIDELFHAIHVAQATEETAVGLFRARGMREEGVR